MNAIPSLPRRSLFQLGGGAALGAATVSLTGPVSAHAARNATLVSRGQATSVILLPADPDPQLPAAADELVRVINRASGATLEVRTVTDQDQQPSPDGTVRICIGFTLPGSDPTIPAKLDGLDPDGLVIAPYGDTLTLIGPTPYGSRHAVLELCESQLGVRWLQPTELGEDVPALESIKVPARATVQAPSMTSRVMYPTPSEGMSWRKPTSALSRWGDNQRTHWRVQFHHELWKMFDSRKFGDPNKPEDYHPEWYPIIKGETKIPTPGLTNGWHPRLTEPSLAVEAARQLVEYFDANPDAPSHSLGLSDGPGFSEDELEGRGTSRTGNIDMSPVYWDFVNRVVDLMLEQRPQYSDKLIGGLAYTYSEMPPPFELRPQVVPFLTGDRYKWADPQAAVEDQQFTLDWMKVAKQVGWYDYVYGNPYCIPRVPLKLYDTITNWGVQNGVIGQMAELSHNWGEGPKPWAYGKKMWDARRSMPTLAQEWYERLAGREARPHLATYYRIWEQLWTDRIPSSMQFRAGRHLPYFPFDDMSYVEVVPREDVDRAEAALNRALAATTNETQAARVQVLIDEFAYYRASALSYPKDLPAPTTAEEALALLEEMAGTVDETVALVGERHRVWDELAGDQDLHYRRTKFDRYGADWSGWNTKVMITLADHVRADGPGAAAVTARATELRDNGSSADVRGWCDHLLRMINDEGVHYGTNLGFEDGDTTGWSFTPNQPIPTAPGVVSDVTHSGDHAVKISGGFLTMGMNQSQRRHRAGPGVWVTRFRYLVPEGSQAQGVFVPGVIAHDWTGGNIAYKQDHYIPMADSAGEWVEARFVDKLPPGTNEVTSVGVAAYMGLGSELYLDDFEYTYYGEFGDGTPSEDTITVEQDGLYLSPSSTESVDDPDALDGKAARLDGDRGTWGVQYHLGWMPETGTFRVVARVKLDLKPGADPNAIGFAIGSYRHEPREATSQTHKNSEFTDGVYKWVSVNGTFSHDSQGKYIYFTGLGNDDRGVEDIYIDRLYLIPA
ncbi:DUF4838 domain-containing protein [Propionibacteriaceae bacterium Y2011]|uniref:DUF4838 domain-containing protein n=1 Tax=Microlunatus sp. Y2014 TaxID=3418488 RepID=UPI003B450BFD